MLTRFHAALISLILLAARADADSVSLELWPSAKGEVEVVALLEGFAQELGASTVISPELSRRRLRFDQPPQGPVDWRSAKHLLRFNRVRVSERALPGGRKLLVAESERRSNSRLWSPRHLSALCPIRSGAASAIYAALRGIDGHKPGRGAATRIGYVQGPELLILVGTPRQLAFARSLIEALDRPGPRQKVRAWTLKYTEAAHLARVVKAFGERPGRAPRVVVEQESNTLIVADWDLGYAEEIVHSLDRGEPSPSATYHVYPCDDPQDLAAKLRQLLDSNEADELSKVEVEPLGQALVIRAEPTVYQDLAVVLNQQEARDHFLWIQAEVWEACPSTFPELLDLEPGGASSLGVATQDGARLSSALREGGARQVSRPGGFSFSDEREIAFSLHERDWSPSQGVSRRTFFYAWDSILEIKIGASRAGVVLDLELDLGSLELESKLRPRSERVPTKHYEGRITIPPGKWVALRPLASTKRAKREVGLPLLSAIPGLGCLCKRRIEVAERTRVYIFLRALSYQRHFDGEIRPAKPAKVLGERSAWLGKPQPPGPRGRKSLQQLALERFGKGSADPFTQAQGPKPTER